MGEAEIIMMLTILTDQALARERHRQHFLLETRPRIKSLQSLLCHGLSSDITFSEESDGALCSAIVADMKTTDDTCASDDLAPPPTAYSRTRRNWTRAKTTTTKGSALMGRLKIIQAVNGGCSRRVSGLGSYAALPSEVVVVDGHHRAHRSATTPASCVSNTDAVQHHELVEELLASSSRKLTMFRKPSRFTFDVVPSVSYGDASATTDGTTSTEGLVPVESDMAFVGGGDVDDSPSGPTVDKAIVPIQHCNLADSKTQGPPPPPSGASSEESAKKGDDSHPPHQREQWTRPRTRTSSTEMTSSTTASTSKGTRSTVTDGSHHAKRFSGLRSEFGVPMRARQTADNIIPARNRPSIPSIAANDPPVTTKIHRPCQPRPTGSWRDACATRDDVITRVAANTGTTAESTSWFAFSSLPSLFF
jgi:hypothetical protein